jgi:YD repeat-containing protein
MCSVQAPKVTVAVVILTICSFLPAGAQVATGSYPYGTYQKLGFDTINVGNLNVHFAIPLLNKPGRGLPFYYDLSYDSSVWYPAVVNGSTVWTLQSFGWRGDTEITTGYVSYSKVTENGRIRGSGDLWYTCPTTIYSEFVYHDPFGVSHSFPTVITTDTSQQPPECNPPASQPNASGLAADGSGYTMNVTDFDVTTMTSKTGKNVTPPQGTAAGTVIDTNGNEISVSNTGVFTDTVGTQVLTVAGGAPNPETFTYLDTHGNQQTVTMHYSAYTVQTNFGCSGIGEYGPTQLYLVSSIVLPDGSSYGFAYEPTPGHSGNVTGRLASITLPQGGMISYGYSGGNNGIECTDGSTAGLTRSITATAGSAASTWSFSRSTGTGTSETTVTDGLNNQSVYSFSEASNLAATAQYYETSRQIYQGTATGTPLLARVTCYNLSSPPAQTCTPATFSLPVTEIDTYSTLNGLEEDGSTAKYNSYGSQTDQYTYDFAASGSRGSLLTHELWTYGADIEGLVSNDELYDGAGHEVADTTYTYDSAGVTATSGVPQHISVSGPRGNLDEISYNTGTTNINVTAQYYDTGSLISVTGPTGTSTPGYDPTYSFMTSITPPTPSSGVSLASSTGYDANTGLILNSTDPNGQEVSYTYDSQLRRSQVNEPDGGKATYAYTPTEKTIDKYQNASAYEETDILYDAYARRSRTEVSNGQAGDPWYQRDSCYDADFRLTFQSYRYQGAGFSQGKLCSGAGDTDTYDALGRVTKVLHADGTYVSYTYSGRATEVSDEEGVTRISQVDGLNRTTAVCEISSNSNMPDSGSPSSCGLDIAGTGFATTYTYTLNTIPLK